MPAGSSYWKMTKPQFPGCTPAFSDSCINMGMCKYTVRLSALEVMLKPWTSFYTLDLSNRHEWVHVPRFNVGSSAYCNV